MISESTIQHVKDSVVTHEIVGSFITTKKKGVDYVASCPFHSEKTPSFTISPAKNIYKCFGCGKSGDGITFLVEHEKMTFIEAIKWIANKNNINVEEFSSKKIIVRPSKEILGNKGVRDKTLEWFNKRGISKETVEKFKIFTKEEYMPQTKKEEICICFPYFKDGELINVKYRSNG